MSIVQEVRAKLPNGFTFVVDFTDSKNSAKSFNMWNAYYRSIGVTADISINICNDLEQFSGYNWQALQLFDQPFEELDCNEKISVVELFHELRTEARLNQRRNNQ